MNYHRRFNFVTYKGNDWVAYILGKEKQHKNLNEEER
jgi:hypothetical protein